jgi:hypothetical protein
MDNLLVNKRVDGKPGKEDLGSVTLAANAPFPAPGLSDNCPRNQCSGVGDERLKKQETQARW